MCCKQEEKEEKHYCTRCFPTVSSRTFKKRLMIWSAVNRRRVMCEHLPWSASSLWCRRAWWSTLRELARKPARWRLRKMCKPWRWRCPSSPSACGETRPRWKRHDGRDPWAVEETLRAQKGSLDSPELEFWQPSDERAKLLVLLGGKGWTFICRWGGAIQKPLYYNLHPRWAIIEPHYRS